MKTSVVDSDDYMIAMKLQDFSVLAFFRWFEFPMSANRLMSPTVACLADYLYNAEREKRASSVASM